MVSPWAIPGNPASYSQLVFARRGRVLVSWRTAAKVARRRLFCLQLVQSPAAGDREDGSS
jgi:hypothetical protein